MAKIESGTGLLPGGTHKDVDLSFEAGPSPIPPKLITRLATKIKAG